MITAAQVLRFSQIWLVAAVAFTNFLLVSFTRVSWSYCWLLAVGCWSFLIIYWTLAARNTKPAAGGRRHFLLFVIEYLLYCLPLSSIPIVGLRFMPRYAGVEILGAVMCAFGVGFATWSRRVLAESWNPVVTLRDCHELVQAGPYAVIRHPIYFGFLTAIVGQIIVLGEVRALLLVIDFAVFLRRMPAEEKLLRAAYPQQYPEYEQRVKRLLPWPK